MKQAGFQGDLPAFIAFLRKDPRFYATSRQQPAGEGQRRSPSGPTTSCRPISAPCRA